MRSAPPTWRRSPPPAASAPIPRPAPAALQRVAAGVARRNGARIVSLRVVRAGRCAPRGRRRRLGRGARLGAGRRAAAPAGGGPGPGRRRVLGGAPRPARFARSRCTAPAARSRQSRRPRPRWGGPTCGAARAGPRAGSTARGSWTSPTRRPAIPCRAAPPRPTCGGSRRPSRRPRSHPPISSSWAPPRALPTTSACTWATGWWSSRRTRARGCASSRSPPAAGTGSAG